METRKARWPKLALVLGLAAVAVAIVLLVSGTEVARSVGVERSAETGVVTTAADQSALRLAGPAAQDGNVGVMSIDGSIVETGECYDPGASRPYCFTVYNGSTNNEWLTRTQLTFPNHAGLGPWIAACSSQDPTDSSGALVNFNCSITPPYNNAVVYTDNNGGWGEVTPGSSWHFCVNLNIPGVYSGTRLINWGLSGDVGGNITGTLMVEQCAPLMLRPSSLRAEGCNGIWQTHVFELWNRTGGAGTFSLFYDVPSSNAAVLGPQDIFVSDGGTGVFTVELKPDFFLEAGEWVTATVHAEGSGHIDSATIVKMITPLAGWDLAGPSPVQTMDNVVVWASHADGGLWSIGGYGANGAVQRYNPANDTWITRTAEISPAIAYPGDGCYGLDGVGDETVVLFPDTIVTGTLHVYNITLNQWFTRPVPVGYPSEGRWAQDIVSLLNTPAGQNVCYLSGGATWNGAGNVRNLWAYYPVTNTTIFLGNFYTGTSYIPITGFDFHASWYVPWVGAGGAICVGGGIDRLGVVISDTQCYDLQTGTFRQRNADLGPLPEPWWGMADGWAVHDGRYQIWIANGISKLGQLLPASAYAEEGWPFTYGPDLPISLYRLEGDGVDGRFFVEQGAAGGFNATTYNHVLVPCPACLKVYLPLVLRNH